MMEQQLNTETIRALKQIIYTIIELNIEENQYFSFPRNFPEELLQTFKNGPSFNKWVKVYLIGSVVEIEILVDMVLKDNLLVHVEKLQHQIYHEITRLTGFPIKGIHLFIRTLKMAVE
jgi:uncharacterized alkaline shock family protein YloU